MQRLPPHRIQRAQELGEIGLEENPAAAGLGAGDEAALGAGADFLGVHAQERGGLDEVEGSYGAAHTGFRFARGCTDIARSSVGHVCAFGSSGVDAGARYTPGCIPAEGKSADPSSGPDERRLSRGSSRNRYRR